MPMEPYLPRCSCGSVTSWASRPCARRCPIRPGLLVVTLGARWCGAGPGRPVEFGFKAPLADNADGIVLDYTVGIGTGQVDVVNVMGGGILLPQTLNVLDKFNTYSGNVGPESALNSANNSLGGISCTVPTGRNLQINDSAVQTFNIYADTNG